MWLAAASDSFSTSRGFVVATHGLNVLFCIAFELMLITFGWSHGGNMLADQFQYATKPGGVARKEIPARCADVCQTWLLRKVNGVGTFVL